MAAVRGTTSRLLNGLMTRGLSAVVSQHVWIPAGTWSLRYMVSRRLMTFTSPCPAKQRRKPAQPYVVKTKNPCIKIFSGMTMSELGRNLNKTFDELMQCLMYLDVNSEEFHPNTGVDNVDLIISITRLSGRRYLIVPNPNEAGTRKRPDHDAKKRPSADPSDLVKRPPIVTIMGHVDHGKTTLLDVIRSTRVADSEFGGITQHIGAFSVKVGDEGRVTFIDTPGHKAFSAMRQRGVRLTDMVVLVVAADDGFMPQTAECMQHIRDSNVAYIVALNKVDKPESDVARALKSMLQNGIQIESMGGDIPCVEISALKGTNVDMLLNTILTMTDLYAVTGDPSGLAEGTVIESKLDGQRGPIATVILQRGSLKRGDSLVCGTCRCRVRELLDDQGKGLSTATLSDPVSISGWKSMPHAGDEVLQVRSEDAAKQTVAYRQRKIAEIKSNAEAETIENQRKEERKAYRERLIVKHEKGNVYAKDRSGPGHVEVVREKPVLPVFLKADVDGSIDAIMDVIDTYIPTLVDLQIINFGVGEITEADAEQTCLAGGVLYGFNVPMSVRLRASLVQQNASSMCPIKVHNVIYHLIDDIHRELNERVPTVDEESILGTAVVQEVYNIKDKRRKCMMVAGCRCSFGELTRQDMYKVVRNDDVIFKDKLYSMKQFKDDASVIRKGSECGLSFNGIDNVVEKDDTIICYKMVAVKPKVTWQHNF